MQQSRSCGVASGVATVPELQPNDGRRGWCAV